MELNTEKIESMMTLMCNDLQEKGKVCIIAYYIRDPKDITDICPTGQAMKSSIRSSACGYDYAAFEKYVHDIVCNTSK